MATLDSLPRNVEADRLAAGGTIIVHAIGLQRAGIRCGAVALTIFTACNQRYEPFILPFIASSGPTTSPA